MQFFFSNADSESTAAASAASGSPASRAQAQATIRRLADRAANSSLLEDRRSAVVALKGLAKSYPDLVGEHALTTLMQVLLHDRDDGRTVRPALEALKIMFTQHDDSHSNQQQHQHQHQHLHQPSAEAIMLARVFLGDSEGNQPPSASNNDGVSILLDYLEYYPDDFYLQYDVIEVLSALARCCPSKIDACIMRAPMGISRLVNLLSSRHDALRNEGVLLLTTLTGTSPELQKIVAFENAFDGVLNIMINEGGIDKGGIVVKDCLALLYSLLKYNTSNQTLFRETNCVQALVKILSPDSGNDQDEDDYAASWNELKIDNALDLLVVIRLLVERGGSATPLNQTAIVNSGLLATLVQMSLSPDTPSSVRSSALLTMGDMISDNNQHQEYFMLIMITPPTPHHLNLDEDVIPEPAIVSVVKLALGIDADAAESEISEKSDPSTLTGKSKVDSSVRLAANYLVKCYLRNNSDGQRALASTLMIPSTDIAAILDYYYHYHLNDQASSSQPSSMPSATAGSLLIASLLSCHKHSNVVSNSADIEQRLWHATSILSFMIDDSEDCKQLADRVRLDGDVSETAQLLNTPISLVHELIEMLSDSVRRQLPVRIPLAILSLLCTWLHSHPPAVTAFLTESQGIQLLIEYISRSVSSINETLMQGMCALLFGVIYMANSDSQCYLSREAMYQIMKNRIGIDVLISRIVRLSESKQFQNVQTVEEIAITTVENDGSEEVTLPYFDHDFVEFVRGNALAAAIRKAVKADPSSLPATMASTKQLQSVNAASAMSPTMATSPNMKDSMELTALRKEVDSLNKMLAAKDAELSGATSKVTSLELQLVKSKQEHEKEHDDMLVYIADQGLLIKKLQKRLKALGDYDTIAQLGVVSDDDDDDDEDEDEGNVEDDAISEIALNGSKHPHQQQQQQQQQQQYQEHIHVQPSADFFDSLSGSAPPNPHGTNSSEMAAMFT
ncbi:hypothetical protein GQ42DRAFT_162133 [Ramicandelaber brevisporus]|nr:hypothetical protein GQ42DRAFT_162133 [Ramicandelaber brevisporus]